MTPKASSEAENDVFAERKRQFYVAAVVIALKGNGPHFFIIGTKYLGIDIGSMQIISPTFTLRLQLVYSKSLIDWFQLSGFVTYVTSEPPVFIQKYPKIDPIWSCNTSNRIDFSRGVRIWNRNCRKKSTRKNWFFGHAVPISGLA